MAKTATKLYPSLAEAIPIVSGVDVWELGNPVEIIPSGVIGFNFRVEVIHVSGISAMDEFEVVLYTKEVEVARESFSKQPGEHTDSNVRVCTQVINAFSPIEARVASKNGGSRSMKLKISYC